MAIKVYGDKIVYPDNSEQTTAFTGEVNKDVYTKEEVDEQQEAQDVEIAKKVNDAPDDSKTYARNNKTWVNISDSSGIPDAPVDGLQYGRQDGEWTEVTGGETPTDVYTKEQTDDLLDEKADKTTTYTKTEVDASQSTQDDAIANNTIAIQANTDAISNLPTPVDTYTKAEIDDQQNAQDVEIAKKANTDDTYTKTQTDTLLDSKANVGDSYTKAETYSNVETDSKLFEKADKTTTYTKTEIDNSQDAQDVNITGNTTAIGTLSGRVSANEADIATLQDGIFFSSSYSADYPELVSRDPETGNMYMQNLSSFTYSYADTDQVFLSKTDEQGNVRQFTAVKPNDTIVLNQVESPNYGRYKVVSVNDMGDYVNIIIEFEIGEGTLLEGDTVALQAFPASAGGTGGIPEAPIDGKQYGRQDATWTEVTGSTPTPEALVWENVTAERAFNTEYTNTNEVPLYISASVTTASPSATNTVILFIDGSEHAKVGGRSDSDVNTLVYLIPSGSTYEIRKDGGGTSLNKWYEARMPVAVGVGGASGGGDAQPPVVMKALVNSTQTLTHGDGGTVLSFGDVKFDDDNTYDPSTKRWIPKVSGYYLVQSGFTTEQVFPAGLRYVRVSLKKNGDYIAYGSQDFQSNTDLGEIETSEVSSIIYMNGTTDYLEVIGGVEMVGATTSVDLAEGAYSYFQSHLITGQSTGGGSGGGGYTPEPLVWQHVNSSKSVNTDYVNTVSYTHLRAHET